MSEATEFTIDSKVTCTDGDCGTLTRVVIDPVARALTHLVVTPPHRPVAGRLVPVELVESAHGEIELSCTLAEFEALEGAEETKFLPGAAGQWSYADSEMLSMPYFVLGLRGVGMGMGLGGVGPEPQFATYDRVPVGEVQVRRGEHVQATDGAIGHVQGLVIDPADHHVTHVLLDEGHLWAHKRVAIPISAVAGVTGGVRLNLTKAQVRDLPPVDLDHHE